MNLITVVKVRISSQRVGWGRVAASLRCCLFSRHAAQERVVFFAYSAEARTFDRVRRFSRRRTGRDYTKRKKPIVQGRPCSSSATERSCRRMCKGKLIIKTILQKGLLIIFT